MDKERAGWKLIVTAFGFLRKLEIKFRSLDLFHWKIAQFLAVH